MQARLHDIYQLELIPFTQNDQSLRDFKAKYLSFFRDKSLVSRSYFLVDEKTHGMKLSAALVALNDLGFHKLGPEDLKRLHPPDTYERELGVMSDVLAYFKVRFPRL